MSSNTLLISVASLKQRTGLHNTVDEKLVLPIIKVAQDMYIKPAIGSALMTRLQTGIDDNNLNTYETTLINDYITDALSWFVMCELPESLCYQFYAKGIVQKTDKEALSISASVIAEIENKHKRYAEVYKQALIKFLLRYRLNYPEYNTQVNYIDSVIPERTGYSTSIYLGDNPMGVKVPSRVRYQGQNGTLYDCDENNY
jgi:hypothetical protein